MKWETTIRPLRAIAWRVVKTTSGNQKRSLFMRTTTQTIICEAQAKEANLERTKSKRSCSSEKEHKVNALAPRADEGRDNLR